MTTEELLIPRVKIIAPMPFINNKVGEWKELRNGFIPLSRIDQYGKCFTEEINPFLYKANFQKMPWYEGRKIEDLPEYVKLESIATIWDQFFYKPGDIIKCDWQLPGEDDYGTMYCKTDQKRFNNQQFHHLLPATLEEYEEYQKSKL